MKKIICITTLFLLTAAGTCFGEETKQTASWDNTPLNEQKNNFILDRASEAIGTNIRLWTKLRGELDGANAHGWTLSLGEKLPTQPLAVIEVLSHTPKEDIGMVCTPPFMEGAEYYEVNTWIDHSTYILESFTMSDPKKETIRQECLERVKACKRMKPGTRVGY